MAQEASDAELIAAVRAGDEDAYAQLYRRHHGPALRYARSLASSSAEAEDLVADAFTRVLAALRTGNGPDEAFRPYLLSAVRNAFYDLTRRANRERPVDDLTPFAPEAPFVDPVLAKDERRLVALAFSELPERWQTVLWHTEVEGEKPASVAPLLGISANAVAALAYRAREGLRERYLHVHLSSTTDEQCRRTTERLAAYTRKKLSKSETRQVHQHLDGCNRCRLLFTELADLNSRLGVILAPIVLGGALGHFASSGPAPTGVGRFLRRPETQAAATTAVLASIVAIIASIVGTASPAPPVAGPFPDPSRSVSAAPTASVTVDPIGPAAGPSGPATSASGAAPTVSTPPESVSPGPTQIPGPTPPPSAPQPGPVPTPPAGTEPVEPAPPTTKPPLTLSVSLGIGVLLRGLPGFIVLAVINPSADPDTANVRLTATLSLPDGVTLRSANAGDGWTCSPAEGGAICERDGLRPAGITLAIVQVSVDLNAAGGLLSALLSGDGLAPVLVTAQVLL